MNLIKDLLNRLMLALMATAMIALFRYLGSFTIPASILLGGSFTIVGLWLYALWKVAAFQPYSLKIFINFDVLCEDLGLPRAPVEERDFVYEIYKFTALTATVFAHYTELTVKTSMQISSASVRSKTGYLTSVTFANRIPCVFSTEPFDNPENRDPRPRFFFRPSRNGYSFGIRVLENWWFEHRKKLGAQMAGLPVDPHGEIVLCVLPYGYVPDHVRRWESTDTLRLYDFRQRQWTSRLSKQGWTISDFHLGVIEHRYLNLTYDHLLFD